MPCASAPALKWDNDIPFFYLLTTAITALEASGALSVSIALNRSLVLHKKSSCFKSAPYIEGECVKHYMFSE